MIGTIWKCLKLSLLRHIYYVITNNNLYCGVISSPLSTMWWIPNWGSKSSLTVIKYDDTAPYTSPNLSSDLNHFQVINKIFGGPQNEHLFERLFHCWSYISRLRARSSAKTLLIHRTNLVFSSTSFLEKPIVLTAAYSQVYWSESMFRPR